MPRKPEPLTVTPLLELANDTDVIRGCRDSKSLVTLLWFRAFVL